MVGLAAGDHADGSPRCLMLSEPVILTDQNVIAPLVRLLRQALTHSTAEIAVASHHASGQQRFCWPRTGLMSRCTMPMPCRRFSATNSCFMTTFTTNAARFTSSSGLRFAITRQVIRGFQPSALQTPA